MSNKFIVFAVATTQLCMSSIAPNNKITNVNIYATAFSANPKAARPAPLRLKELLEREMSGDRKDEMPILLPCCYDGLTARLVARAGFEATFMTGFGVSGKLVTSCIHFISYTRFERQSAFIKYFAIFIYV